MIFMTKLKLKLLLVKYKHEISIGNNEHLKDLIAVMVLLDLSYFDMSIIESIDKITLNYLIPFLNVSIQYQVPTMEKINLLKKKYRKAFKRCGIPIDYIYENAATTWIGMMIYFGIIREGQIINPKEFVLLDFMTDDKLISIFELNRLSIIDYNNKIKKIN